MSLSSSRKQKDHDNTDRWLLTYSDMITLLMTFFLMLYSMSAVNAGKFQAVASSLRQQMGSNDKGNGSGQNAGTNSRSAYASSMQKLRQYVETHGLAGQVNMHEDERGLVITLLADKLLFDAGSADLRSGAEPVLGLIAKVLKTVPNKIFVEGHTDDRPINTERFPSNWELSGARASTVLRSLEAQHGIASERMSVSGYASTRPIVANDSDAHRGMNRRVDIVIVKTDEQRAQMEGQTDGFETVLGQSGTSIDDADAMD